MSAPTRDAVSWRTVIRVPGMDCTAEEALVRATLQARPKVETIACDLQTREVTITHQNDEGVVEAVATLGFGAELVAAEQTERTEQPDEDTRSHAGERRVLTQVLVINAVMFVVELALGWVAQSTGLLADSLDMLADASVYAISLYVVSRGADAQRRSARLSGLLQLTLATGMLVEVGRRAVQGSEPASTLMMATAAAALAANLLCVWLLRRHRDGRAHMRASWIFTTSDALANLGVIVAGGLVAWTASPWPDLVVGAGIALVVLWSAFRILKLR
ncbi:MAG: cation transporter [Sandaracinaceae bacterium]